MSPSRIQTQTRRALLRRGIIPLLEEGAQLSEILERLIQNVEGQSEAKLAAIIFYDQTENCIRVGVAPHVQPSYLKAINGYTAGPFEPACARAVCNNERVICSDVNIDPVWTPLRDLAAISNFRAVWSQPIIDNSRNVLGTVAFYFSEPKSPDSSDLLVLESAAELAALAIQSRKDEFEKIIEARKTFA